MKVKALAVLTGLSLLSAQCVAFPAYADNQMGYRLLSAQEASSLPATEARWVLRSTARSRSPTPE